MADNKNGKNNKAEMERIMALPKEELETLDSKVVNIIETTTIKKGRSNDNEEFLIFIKDKIEKALDKKLSFTAISKIIFDSYNIKLSSNILKTFAISQDLYSVKPRGKKEINVVDTNSSDTNTAGMSVKDRKIATANAEQDEDSL